MKDNYQEKYNMDRDLIWEAYGQVHEQVPLPATDMTQSDAIPGQTGHPSLRQVEQLFAQGPGASGGEVQQQVAALEIARDQLEQEMPTLAQAVEKDMATAQAGNPVQMDPGGDYASQVKWQSAKDAWTIVSKKAQEIAPVAQSMGIHMGTLLESLVAMARMITELHNKHGLVIDESWGVVAKEVGKAAATAAASKAAENLADRATKKDEELEEASHDCKKSHPDSSHAEWKKKNVKEEGTDGETGDLTSREKMLLAQDAEKKGKKVLKGDVPDAVQKENCPFADEDSLEGDPLELDRIEDGDTEGRMAKKDLYKLAKYASELHNMIEDGEDLEGWVQAKIAKAADYIGAVFHFMDYDEARDEDSEHGKVQVSDIEDIL
jgi:hypothetical protein